MAVMVWCQGCKKVVWAYDHQPPVDLRGICNMLALPCPKCGEVGNFNGWSLSSLDDLKGNWKVFPDLWSAMHSMAEREGVEWEPSGNNHWFPEELNDQIKNLIQWERR